jgi:hypothetical protein
MLECAFNRIRHIDVISCWIGFKVFVTVLGDTSNYDFMCGEFFLVLWEFKFAIT